MKQQPTPAAPYPASRNANSRPGSGPRTVLAASLLAIAMTLTPPGPAVAGVSAGSDQSAGAWQPARGGHQTVAAIAWDDDPPMGFDTLNIELGGSLTRPAKGGQSAPRGQGTTATSREGWLDRYNRTVLQFNLGLYNAYMAVYDKVVGPRDPSAPPPDPTRVGSLGNVILNLVNEPLTMVSSALVGDLANSGNAVRRFAINSTAGLLGWWDQAGAWGYKARYTDIGLALCKYGVGEGGYVVLPLIGPRTLRDAFGDLAWSGTLAVTTLGPVASQPALPAGAVVEQTRSMVMPVGVTADVLAGRYFDPVARRIMTPDPDQVREIYLAQRRQRCAG